MQSAPDAPACPVDRAQLRRWVRAALERDAALTLRFVGEDEGRRLNRSFRGRPHATNVLTFAYEGDAVAPARGTRRARSGPVQGDIVLCLPVVAREAREQGKRVRDHLAHLVVHGVLHAQGWDHENLLEAQRMEAREVQILRRFRIANPYR